MIGVRSSSSLSVIAKRVRMKSLFVSRFSPDVTSADIEGSLKDQLKLTSLTCTRLNTKFNSYASFHISVVEDDFHLVNNIGVWPSGCLIAPYFGRLTPEQIYSPPTLSSRPSSPGAEVSALGVAPSDQLGANAISEEPPEDGATSLS
ncbi:hypothetical protein L798_13261 [Zootermopsis nevadensis]|uniref:Uncharacterized protein n=1 Tax=Zootermopsis nevadensis TaxID=136037 RepID=A0A067QUU1_ZOONE|nr:hypothetical protein L798_13261 [Zootermopsis nevadensis]